ncbi:hypothetical protein MIND_00062400 [Mycena indigotica]|uniref:Uncharacterized protein n=1 Tax=Mycena indigotica TaxID=2126181 RepID=A0A8H6WK87_9AGAR|nr:uncharacterized protein MIND_00062400 [Mycena indigotica]KAF7315474.1 hypothetical protein MIND_00062400 [Mycena indigotica]
MSLFASKTTTTTDKTPPSTPKRKSRVLHFRSKSDSSKTSPSPPTSPTTEVAVTQPSSPTKRTPLGIAEVANIFVRMRRASDKAKNNKSWHIQSSSGPAQSHPGVLEGASELREIVTHRDVYICNDGVNVGQLLRATRNALMEDAEFIGANALVDEQWDCTICGPRHRRSGSFKVEISYSAAATRSERADPHKPIAIDKAKGVPASQSILNTLDRIHLESTNRRHASVAYTPFVAYLSSKIVLSTIKSDKL